MPKPGFYSSSHNVYGGAMDCCFTFVNFAATRDETVNLFYRHVMQNQMNDSFISNFAQTHILKSLNKERTLESRLNKFDFYKCEDDLNS